MRRPVWTKSTTPPTTKRPANPGFQRDRLAVLAALATLVGLGAAFLFAKSPRFLMPGPLTSAHSGIENCVACHTKSGTGKLTWLPALMTGDPVADTNACLTCHQMPDTAFHAHGVSAEVLEQSTRRLTKVAAKTPAPRSARVQSSAFPTDAMVAHGLYCATCHQEHQGGNFNLKKISNEQCRSCHVVKFDSFDHGHPKFDGYPFERRTRIIYDHAGHFGKHFPEVAKKDPAKRVPDTCSACHSSSGDRRLMAVAPFEQTCSACHLDQINGKERVSGPKGFAFLTLPGLDLQTLKKKKAMIGEWPEASEAKFTPFMKMMIGRSERGRALIKAVEGLNLQDLASASDDQINAVTNLIWEIKRLFYALITGKASDVLADLHIDDGSKLSASLVSDLTANMPRDAIVGAQQQWLPNLAAEMADRQDPISAAKAGTPVRAGQQAPAKKAPDAGPAKTAAAQPDAGASPKVESANPAFDGANKTVAAGERPGNKSADQTDDLLHPTEEELRGLAIPRGAGKAPQPEASAPKAETVRSRLDSAAAADAGPKADAKTSAPARADLDAANVTPPAKNAPAISIPSDIDPENWADYGGWYRQDFSIFYRPTGHKDRFIYSWLSLTGPSAPKGHKSPAAAVFDYLSSKDAPGSCTKCHSVDDIQGEGRLVNFSPPRIETKQGRFTNFVHEPHFSIPDSRGCLACHNLEKSRPYLKSYEQGNPKQFVSSFAAIKKELCQSCHTSGSARQDCLLCHGYHVNGVITPMMKTKVPTE